MKKYIVAAGVMAASLLVPQNAQAQRRSEDRPVLPRQVLREYEAISASVVRLRTVADMRLDVTDPRSGLRSQVKRPLEIHGSGVIIGEVEVDGRPEYLVLTNHHVADPSNYVVQEGYKLRENRKNTRAEPVAQEETFLTLSPDGESSPDDIRLIEVARDVRGDMTVLRTVGAPAGLAQFTGAIGYRAGEVDAGSTVITSGFPHGGRRITDTGTILHTGRRHDLGQPHDDFVLSVVVEHGQSGSPVFLVETDEIDGRPTARFTLIGLLHARERGISFMVPYSLWKGAMAGIPSPVAERLAP